jgi:hypothetical protein
MVAVQNLKGEIIQPIFFTKRRRACTSVLQLGKKVSFKSNEPFRQSYAYKPISPYRTYFRV